MNKFVKSFLCFAMAVLCVFLEPMTALAKIPADANQKDYTGGSHANSPSYTATWSVSPDGNENVWVIVCTADKGKYKGIPRYGMDSANYCQNYQTDGGSLDALCEQYGVEGGKATLMSALGITWDGTKYKRFGQNLREIDLTELPGWSEIPRDPDPTPVIPPPDPGPDDSCPYTDTYNWCLITVDVTGEAETNGTTNRIETGIPSPTPALNRNLYRTSSTTYEQMYSNGNGWSGVWYRPQWTYMAESYTAVWYKIRKRVINHNVCSNHCSHRSCDNHSGGHWTHHHYTETIYSKVDEGSQTVSIDYFAPLYYPEWEEEYPIDLTTETAWTGGYNIVDYHGHTNLKAPVGTGGTVDISVSKTSFGAGEMLNLLSTNEPGEFFVDFGNSWFGISPDNHLDGGGTYKTSQSEGYSWINWAQLYYGGDHLQNDRAEKINTITKLNSATSTGTETVSTEDLTITGGNPYSGKYKFNMRSVYPTSSGSYYMLGEAGNDVWVTYFEECVNNIKGVDWKAGCTRNPNSLTTSIIQKDYTKYVIWNKFKQPILRGEYDVKTPAAR